MSIIDKVGALGFSLQKCLLRLQVQKAKYYVLSVQACTLPGKIYIPHYQERCHPSQSQTRGLDGAEQCVVTARRSRLMSEGG